jgi:uncharacterized protein (DUF2384 family)
LIDATALLLFYASRLSYRHHFFPVATFSSSWFCTMLGVLLLGVTALASCHIANASPQTIQLTARQIPKRTFARRALAPVTLPLTDYFNGTDLQ